MKSILLRRKCVCSLFFLALLSSSSAFCQTFTPKPDVYFTSNCNGYYEYLPQGYESGSETYPLILFLHGTGEEGDGSATGLTKLTNTALPKLILNGKFPTSFTVNGKTYKVIVIAPQCGDTQTDDDIEAVLAYLESHYRIDTKRIYMTGLSMGGGALWQYVGDDPNHTKKIAAVVPICGASYPDNDRARTIAAGNLPVWATDNADDGAYTGYTTGYVSKINAPPAPIPPAKITLFPVTGHDAWTQTYDPTFEEDNMNIYEWMLQFDNTRSLASPLPIILSDYKAFLSGNKEVTISWATSSEINNRYFTIEQSADGSNFSVIGQVPATDKSTGDSYSYVDNNPNYGNNFYRLSQTDLDGKTVKFEIKNVVVSNGDGSNKLIIFPNPADSYVTLQLSDKETGQLEIRIIDAAGKVQNTFHYDKTNSYWQQQLPVNGLPAGYYIIDVRGSQLKRTQGFIKK